MIDPRTGERKQPELFDQCGIPSEAVIAAEFYRRYFRAFRMLVPNCAALGWEADLLGLTKSGELSEFEIKRTACDYRKDFLKADKHAALQAGRGEIPVRFAYVVPDCMLREAIEGLPDYAGLLTFDAGFGFREIVAAPKLHDKKCTRKIIERLTSALNARHWNLRLEQINET